MDRDVESIGHLRTIKRIPLITVSLLVFALIGCKSIPTGGPIIDQDENAINGAVTQAETISLNTFVPVDALPIRNMSSNTCPTVDPKWKTVLASLPDNTSRVAVYRRGLTSEVSLVGNTIGVKGNHYQVVLDFMNSDVTPVSFIIQSVENTDGTSIVEIKRNFKPRDELTPEELSNRLQIPVFVGLGLRLIADIFVAEGTVDLNSLGAIAAAASANTITGSMSVQTLGVTGETVINLLPLPSSLTASSVESAIQSLGAIKALINVPEKSDITPRVVGFVLPAEFNDAKNINKIVAELGSARVTWFRACTVDVAELPKK